MSEASITWTRISALRDSISVERKASMRLAGKFRMKPMVSDRIISCFEESGILKKVDLRKDSIFFEMNDDHHHHIVCVKCGEIEDFKENKDIGKILRKVVGESKKFKDIKEHSLELFGYCKICN